MKKLLTKSMYIALLSSKIDFAVGGQAIIEGVMMRSPNHITMAVRKKNGEIVTKEEKFQSITQRIKILGLPLIRGVVSLFEMMIIGMKAINFSANESIEEEPNESTEEMKKTTLYKIFETIMMLISIGFALTFSLFLFKFIPLWTTEFISSNVQYIQDHYILYNLIDGTIKTTLFVSYIAIIGAIPSFKRVFQYHGAEHKSIYTYENNLSLTKENAKKQSRFHPRCGTSFVIIVFAISIFVYSLVPRHEVFLIHFLRRVAFLPLVAGIAYEALKLSAKNIDSAWVRALISPGLWFQRLTTKEPSEKQLEVGLTSLENALKLEGEITH